MILPLIILLHSFQLASHTQDSLKVFHINGFAQGTTYATTYYAHEKMIDPSEVDALLLQIDSSLSLYKPYSLITQFNHHQRSVQSDQHLHKVVQKAIEVSTSTHHAFDITCKPLIDLWNKQLSNNKKPSEQQLIQIKNIIGSQHLQLAHDSLIKDAQLVQIDCDGIAQGYSVDQLAKLFLEKNIQDFIIEIGGEVYSNGHPPGKSNWDVAIHAYASEPNEHSSLVVKLSNYAITTSGRLSKYTQMNAEYFSHVFNPTTGQPVNNNIIAVTVLAKDAMTADALDNAFMVMGIDQSMQWLANHPDIGVLFQFMDMNGNIQRKSNIFFQQYLTY